MKRLLLLALTAVMMAGCKNYSTPTAYRIGERYYFGECEYIFGGYNFTHAGDCKYCEEKRKQEIRELIKELKME